MSLAHIAILDDEPDITALLGTYLRSHGFRVSELHHGAELMALMQQDPPSLVLLDLGLPGEDGLTIAHRLREIGAVGHLGLIIVSGRGDAVDRVVGLEIGADDYITKPFDLDVLLARIQARLRRAPAGVPLAGGAAEASTLSTGDLVLDRDAHTVRTTHGEANLNPKEFELLELLVSRPGHLFPREEIVERVWHQRYLATSRTLDVHVRRLRAKLEQIRAEATLHTVRGVGYRLGVADKQLTARGASRQGGTR